MIWLLYLYLSFQFQFSNISLGIPGVNLSLEVFNLFLQFINFLSLADSLCLPLVPDRYECITHFGHFILHCLDLALMPLSLKWLLSLKLCHFKGKLIVIVVVQGWLWGTLVAWDWRLLLGERLVIDWLFLYINDIGGSLKDRDRWTLLLKVKQAVADFTL